MTFSERNLTRCESPQGFNHPLAGDSGSHHDREAMATTEVPFSKSCPINQRTGDGRLVGRCWHHLPDGKTCPVHGDVSEAVDRYKSENGRLTCEPICGTKFFK